MQGIAAKRTLLDACPVCGLAFGAECPPPLAFDTPRGVRQWAHCAGCGSFFALDRYSLEQEIAHTRTRPWGRPAAGIALNEAKSPMFDAILRLLHRYQLRNQTLLDVGCSFGGFLQRAQAEGYRVRGMDIVPEAVDYVRSQGIPCDCAGAVADLELPAGSQGMVAVLDCNYYWQDHRGQLSAIHRLLSEDGLLVMRVVDLSWLARAGFQLAKLFPVMGRQLCRRAVYDHHVSVPVRALLRIVAAEGFAIVHASAREAKPFRHNSVKVRFAYALGQIVWRLREVNLAPGFVIVARKRKA